MQRLKRNFETGNHAITNKLRLCIVQDGAGKIDGPVTMAECHHLIQVILLLVEQKGYTHSDHDHPCEHVKFLEENIDKYKFQIDGYKVPDMFSQRDLELDFE